MNKFCAIVKDLAPLYVEGLTSEETNEFIEEHLDGCTECRSTVESLYTPAPMPTADAETVAPLKKINKYLHRRQNLAMLAAALAVTILFILVGGFMTTPEYLSVEKAVININHSTSSNRIQVVFSEKTADCRVEGPYDHNGIDIYYVSAWTTPWHQLFGSGMRNHSVWIEYESNSWPTFYYNANDGSEMVPLLGSATSGGIVALPRLTLNYYALMAAGALLVTGLLYFPLHKKHLRLWVRLVFIPLCYLAAHFAILLVSPDTYSISRNFCLILLLALILYGAAYLLSVLTSRFRKKQA